MDGLSPGSEQLMRFSYFILEEDTDLRQISVGGRDVAGAAAAAPLLGSQNLSVCIANDLFVQNCPFVDTPSGILPRILG